MTSRSCDRRCRRVSAAEALAASQFGVISRRGLAALDVSRHDVQREVRRGRWVVMGRQTIAIHRGPVAEPAHWRRALWEIGDSARLDASTALAAHGLVGYQDGLHVGVPHGVHVCGGPDIRVHRLRRWSEHDTVMRGGLRVTRTPLAAIHAAVWSRSRRQAVLILAMSVQQRLTTGRALASELARMPKIRWRELIAAVAEDLSGGVQSLGELDVARECRRRGLPEPDRQVVRHGRRGRTYLDVRFERYGVVIEIEGAHHGDAGQLVDDALRQNELAIARDAVLRIPIIGWRIDAVPFIDQVERALRERGWPGP
jgi:hypothetical protein